MEGVKKRRSADQLEQPRASMNGAEDQPGGSRSLNQRRLSKQPQGGT